MTVNSCGSKTVGVSMLHLVTSCLRRSRNTACDNVITMAGTLKLKI